MSWVLRLRSAAFSALRLGEAFTLGVPTHGGKGNIKGKRHNRVTLVEPLRGWILFLRRHIYIYMLLYIEVYLSQYVRMYDIYIYIRTAGGASGQSNKISGGL